MIRFKSTMVLGLVLLTGSLVSNTQVTTTAINSPSIKNMVVRPVPNYPVSLKDTMVTVNGPGPIVSVQWRYYYAIVSYQENSRDLRYKVIDNIINNGTTTMLNRGNTPYTLVEALTSTTISNILGCDISDCANALKSISPYGLVDNGPISDKSPIVNVAPGSQYQFVVLQDSVEYTICARVEKRTWSWGSWKKWKQEGDTLTYKIDFNFFRVNAFVSPI